MISLHVILKVKGAFLFADDFYLDAENIFHVPVVLWVLEDISDYELVKEKDIRSTVSSADPPDKTICIITSLVERVEVTILFVKELVAIHYS